jgi:hypothetical protein
LGTKAVEMEYKGEHLNNEVFNNVISCYISINRGPSKKVIKIVLGKRDTSGA